MGEKNYPSKQKNCTYLKSLRVEARLSQAEVASMLGHKTPQFISNWERGVCLPPIKDLKTLAGLFSISPEDLFEYVLTVHIDNIRREFRKEQLSANTKKNLK